MTKEDATATNSEKEEKLVPVGEGAEAAPEETLDEQVANDNKKDQQEAEGETDERVGHAEDEDDDDAVEGETADQKRERRRRERKHRREKDARLRREVNYLRDRNEALERKFSQTLQRVDQHEVLSIDQRIGGIDSQIRQAESIHAQAIANQDGEAATEALRIRDELVAGKNKLLQAKERRATTTEEQSRPQTAPRVDTEVASQAQAWMKRNAWFDGSLGDETSHLVKVMEDRLSHEGDYDPRDPEYWNELDRRIARRFPDLKKRATVRDDDDDDGGEVEESRPAPKKKPSGPKFSVGGRERALGKNEVYIDAERRRAMEDAGVWDDPVLRDRYLKAYQRYDTEARNK